MQGIQRNDAGWPLYSKIKMQLFSQKHWSFTASCECKTYYFAALNVKVIRNDRSRCNKKQKKETLDGTKFIINQKQAIFCMKCTVHKPHLWQQKHF